MFPLSAVLFPHASMPLHVFEPRYRELMRDCLAGDAALRRRADSSAAPRSGAATSAAALGTRGVITEAVELPDGRWVLEVEGEALIEVEEWLPDDPYPVALVRRAAPGAGRRGTPPRWWAPPGNGCAGPGPCWRSRAVRRPSRPSSRSTAAGTPSVASWQLCAAAPLSAYDAQRLLAADGAPERLRLLAELMEELELDLHRMLGAE